MQYDHTILISIDTLRSDCIAANPIKLYPSKYRTRELLKTAALDAMASAGVFLANCVSTAPYTAASHGTFFTGRWPLNHGAHEFFNGALSCETVFEVAREHGLRTVFKTDFPVILGKHLNFTRGVDDYIIEDDDAFIEALLRPAKSFGFAHFGGVHVPYGFHNLRFGGERYARKVAELEAEIGALPATLGDQLLETYRDEQDRALLLRYKAVVQHHYEARNYDRLFDLYLEGINHFMALRFEPFLDKLLSGLRGRSYLIVLFGDHGEEYDDSSYGHFNTLSEGALRVPVIFYGTDVPQRLITERTRSVDVLATLVDRLDWDRPWAQDGRSMQASVWADAPVTVRNSFAQAYTSDTAEFVAFQKVLLQTDIRPGPLRHVRYKEAVYAGAHKLVRQNFNYSLSGGKWGLTKCEPKLELLRFDARGMPEPTSSPELAASLSTMLDSYNELLIRKQPIADVTSELRLQLNALGYRI